ncbi:MAG: anaerobic ribonucleoside-triphosphate reductase activating protein [Treponema sp.]|jgi:anaerobic ribonucleoside-triphosphate reductase activating protein|nr:anaerobic ribonucleoside-triphosphate reductase activating protein [Treponema sp.]
MNSGITGVLVSGRDFSPPADTCIDALNIGGIEPESIVDGPGFRYTVFVQGCHFHCPGCHNPRLQNFSGGREMAIGELLRDIKANPLLDGLTLSGGDPFTQAAACAVLAEKVRALGLSVITFTGYLWEDLLDAGREDWLRLIEESDIIVDGPFIMALRDIDLHFRGSANQRLIDVRRSLAAGRAVILPLWEH